MKSKSNLAKEWFESLLPSQKDDAMLAAYDQAHSPLFDKFEYDNIDDTCHAISEIVNDNITVRELTIIITKRPNSYKTSVIPLPIENVEIMNSNRDHLECLCDIAMEVGHYYQSNHQNINETSLWHDSRERVSKSICWAEEFMSLYGNTDWAEVDYSELIQDFVKNKIESSMA